MTTIRTILDWTILYSYIEYYDMIASAPTAGPVPCAPPTRLLPLAPRGTCGQGDLGQGERFRV